MLESCGPTWAKFGGHQPDTYPNLSIYLKTLEFGQYAEKLTVVVFRCFDGVLKSLVSKLLVFLGFLEVLEGLERSGRMTFLQISSKSDLMVPSYDKKQEITIKNNGYFCASVRCPIGL